jgi:succinate dehydrogenase (ubiquinone) membrane anchor subunit
VFPPPDKSHGSYHWTFERLLSASLVPLVASTAVTSVNPVLDGILAVAIVAHSHIGFDSVLIDYVHERKFPLIGKMVKWLLRAATAGVLVGVYQFNTNDVGKYTKLDQGGTRTRRDARKSGADCVACSQD